MKKDKLYCDYEYYEKDEKFWIGYSPKDKAWTLCSMKNKQKNFEN